MGEEDRKNINLSINVEDLQRSLLKAIQDGVFTMGVKSHIEKMLEGANWQKEWWLKQTAEEFLKVHIERMVNDFMAVQANRDVIQQAVSEMLMDDLPREIMKNIVERLGK